MRATIMKGSCMLLMAADTLPGTPSQTSDSIAVAIHSESLVETERLFAAFSEDGVVTLPLHWTGRGVHAGELTDRFGIHWRFQFVQSI